MAGQAAGTPAYPSVVGTYYGSRRLLLRFQEAAPRPRALHALLEACLTGVWLGVLTTRTLDQVDEVYYNDTSQHPTDDYDYLDTDYNKKGLWDWEQSAIEGYFPGHGRVLVTSAGGGREVLALCRLGYEVDGFECNPQLARFANELLRAEGAPASVCDFTRRECPPGAHSYDGVVVGWASYSHMLGSRNRIAFLTGLRARLSEGSPLLISFFYHPGRSRSLQVIAAIANAIRRLLRRDLVQYGDSLGPNFEHYFDEEQIRDELEAAGFRLEYYSEEGYGHAVATAAPLPLTAPSFMVTASGNDEKVQLP